MQYIYIIGVTLSWILIALAILHVIMDNRQPAKTMAWALVIFFLPVVGLVLYLFFGLNHRRERLAGQRQLDELSKRSMLSFVEQPGLQLPDAYRQLIDLFVNQNLSLPFRVERTDVLTDGYQFFPALLRDIAAARHHVHINMYIIEDDALGRLVADALVSCARRGVEVRIIYDDVGCWRTRRRYFERLREEGIEVCPFLPVHFPTFTSKLNYRNHRKLVVIDGRVGYVGGMNIARRYAAPSWRDTMLRLEGNIVYSLQRAFLVDWYFVDGTLITKRDYYPVRDGNAVPRDGNAVPPLQADTQLSTVNYQLSTVNYPLAQLVTSAPTNPWPEIMQGYVRAITTARRYIYIQTPYFLPNEPVLFALKTAAVSGVDVRLMCPLASDSHLTDWASRPYLRELHEAGARVLLYRPGFLHSKLMVIDDALATCGSTNVDVRSFENNFEANLFLYDAATARRLHDVFLADEQRCQPLADLPRRLHPRFLPRLWESLVRLCSPLL